MEIMIFIGIYTKFIQKVNVFFFFIRSICFSLKFYNNIFFKKPPDPRLAITNAEDLNYGAKALQNMIKLRNLLTLTTC